MRSVSAAVAGIYPILDAGYLHDSTLFGAWTRHKAEEVAAAIARADIAILQLRCKGSGKAAFDFLETWMTALRTECRDTALIINDRVDLALYFEADGVHVGQDDLPVHLCRRLLGEKRLIGLSTHDEAEIRHAAETAADYIGFGPVYPTTTKTDTHDLQGIENLLDAVRSSPLPVAAIGGIGVAQVAEVAATGVAAAAMISGLWGPDGRPSTARP